MGLWTFLRFSEVHDKEMIKKKKKGEKKLYE